MKTIVPWSIAMALLASSLLLLTRNRRVQAELSATRQQSEQLRQAQTRKEESKAGEVRPEELARLRRENEELHRLRNEVRQLREQRQQAAAAATSAPTPGAAPPSAPLQLTAADLQQLQQQIEQLTAENHRLRRETQALNWARSLDAQSQACVNNLRIIEGAKEQWALENRKVTGTIVNVADIQPYLKGNVVPACPAGGVCTIGPVGSPATCSVPGHAIPRFE